MGDDEYAKSLVVVPIVSFVAWAILYGNQPNGVLHAAIFSAFVFVVIAIFGRF